MKKLYILILALQFSLSGYSQTFEWLKTVPIDYEFNPGSISYTTCTDSDGNIYFFGLQEHLIFYNQAMGTQFLKKYNPDGSLEWEKTISGEALAMGIYCDLNGGVYLYGQLHSDLDFWGDLSIYFQGISTNSFLVKINYDGDIEWGINLEDLPLDSGDISDIVSDESGMLYVSYSTWLNSYILKINSSGEYIGSIVQENVSLISGLDRDSEGNIYATGSCAGINSIFGGMGFTAPFPYTTYIVKYNNSNQPEWVKFIEDITCPALKIKCDNAGGLYVAGQYFFETMLDTIMLHGAEWVYDFFLSRLNSEGQYQWALECPEILTGDATLGRLQFLETDNGGNALLAGFTRGFIDWGNGIVSNSGDLYYNIIVWNVSQNGSINWVKTAGGEGYDDSHSISNSPDGDIYLAGIAGGTAMFDTITFVTEDFVYPFLAKIDIPEFTDVIKRGEKQSALIYPNPALDKIYIQSENEESFIIYNSRGERILDGNLNKNINQINLERILPGIYFLLTKSNINGTGENCKISGKMIKFI